MTTVRLYIPDADAELVEQAKAEGEASLSAIFREALHRWADKRPRLRIMDRDVLAREQARLGLDHLAAAEQCFRVAMDMANVPLPSGRPRGKPAATRASAAQNEPRASGRIRDAGPTENEAPEAPQDWK